MVNSVPPFTEQERTLIQCAQIDLSPVDGVTFKIKSVDFPNGIITVECTLETDSFGTYANTEDLHPLTFCMWGTIKKQNVRHITNWHLGMQQHKRNGGDRTQ